MRLIQLGLYGFIRGVLIVCVATTGLSLIKVYECEQNLPRTQQCVLVAVPEDSQ